MTSPYTLYGAPLSLYTGKARAYMIYKNQAFEEVFSSFKVYKNIIVPNTGVRFIPVVKTPQGEYLQDTVAIIEHMEAAHAERPVIPATAKQKLVSYLFETWADEWLLIPAMHYRWNKDNFPFIYEEFGAIIARGMPAFIRAFIGKRIGAKFKGFVPLLGITEKSIPAIENWYENHVLKCLDEHFAKHDYLLGDKPCVGDFGLMGPLYAHLYRDPEPGRIMKRIAPNVAQWVERMNTAKASEGDYLANDEIPETLIPILSRMFAEQWPVLADTVKVVQNWAQRHPDEKELPRVVGKHLYTIGDVSEMRGVGSFPQWKVQRVLACYNGFEDADKATVDELLRTVGGVQYMQMAVPKPIKRENNKLFFV